MTRACALVVLAVASACGGGGGEAGGVDGAASAEVARSLSDCRGTSTSTLPGVRIVFAEQPCNYTLAQAAAGIEIVYDVVIEASMTGVMARPQDSGGCAMPGTSGLIILEELSGGSERYCVCDFGLGEGAEPTVDLAPGIYRTAFRWTGRNWGGPSDTNMPMGAPLPPGSYNLRVSAWGSYRGTDYTVAATFPVRLTR
jgi:hypothetical protein